MMNPCPNCGGPLDAAGMAGLCPRCLALDFLSPTGFDPGTASAFSGSPTFPEERRVGGYELLEELGRGGMGVVYRARQSSLNRDVAIKFLLHGALAGDQAMARFRAEAEAVAGLRHPNIVAIHEVGEDQGRHFQAMELVEGTSLAHALREGPMAAIRAAGYMRSVAGALQYSHEHGVIHRDLKPANVLIDHRDEPRVTDFGLAKRFGNASDGSPLPELTLPGEVVGTPAYLSPEQAEGGAVDARSDVYSLGALLYHLITGRPPFVGESATQVLRQVAQAEPVSPRLLNPSVPRDLETICLKCLEKAPSRRYGSARSLEEDLGRFLRDEAILARPIAPAERAWRWCKRKPALAASVAGIAALLAGIAIVSTTSARRIELLRVEGLTNLYASDMRLAQHAIDGSKFGAAVDLLARHIPKTGDPDLRGFEWWHFQERCRSDEAADLGTHGAQVQRVAFSPDGRYLATASTEIQLWDVAARQRMWGYPAGDYVWALAFAPNSAELCAGLGGGTVIRLGVGETPRGLATLTNLTSRPLGFAWNANTTSIAILTQEGLVNWDGLDPGTVSSLGPRLSLNRAQVAAGGRFAAGLSGSKSCGAWRLDPFEPMETIALPETSRAAALSPDGEFLAVGAFSGALHVFDLQSHRRTNVIRAHQGLVECVTFAPDGLHLASAGADRAIRIHETSSGTLSGEWQGHRGVIFALAFSPDGRWLVSGDVLGSVKLWDTRNPPSRFASPKNLSAGISDDGTRVVTRFNPTTIEIHPSAEWPGAGLRVETPSSWLVMASASAVAAITPEGKLQTLDTNHVWREQSVRGGVAAQSGVISSDGHYVQLSVKGETGPLIWDLWARRELLQITNETRWVGASFSGDGKRFGYGTMSGWLRVWDLQSKRQITSLRAHSNSTYDCAFSHDGRKLVTAGFDGRVKLWDVDRARLLGEFQSAADAYWTVALSPDERRIAAGTSESSVVLWDVPSQQEVATLKIGGPLTLVEGELRFTPDSRALLRVSGVVNQWNAPVRGQDR